MKDISDKAVTSYLKALLWSETAQETFSAAFDDSIVDVEEGTSLDAYVDVSDLVDNCRGLQGYVDAIVDGAQKDLEEFRDACLEDLGIDPFRFFDEAQVAHDFALARNGHGAGFFDRSYAVTAEKELHRLHNALQRIAGYMGNIGLDLYANEHGVLAITSHG